MDLLIIFLGLVYVQPEMPPIWLMGIIGIVFIFSMVLIGRNMAANFRNKSKPTRVEDW